MLDPFESPRALLRRAVEHIQELEARFRTFIAREPYAHFVRPDLQTGRNAHGVRFVEAVPTTITVVAYDAVNTLRSTLDHAVYASAVALGHSDPRSTKFPFADTEANVRRYAADGHPDEAMQEHLAKLAPHSQEGGNHLLWALNKLRNLKNHRKLVQFEMHIRDLKASDMISFGGGVKMSYEWNTEHDELVFMYTDPSGQYSGYKLEIETIIEIGALDVLAGKPAAARLYELAQISAEIIDGIEEETHRIKQGRRSSGLLSS